MTHVSASADCTGVVDADRARPAWIAIAFTVLIALTPAMPHVSLGGTGLDVTDLPALAATAVGLWAILRYPNWQITSPRRAPEAYALALMVPFTLIAALNAGTIHSLAAGPARWALNAIMVLSAYLLLRTPRDGIRMLRALVAVATFEAVFGLVAYTLRWVGPGGYIGISFNGGKIGGMPVWGRITGTTGMASTFVAGLFALALPIAVGLAMAALRGKRWPWIVSALLIFFGLAFTLSRVPIALGTGAVVVLLLASTKPRIWVPTLAVGAALFLLTPLRARMTNFSTDRVPLWKVGMRMFRDHWAFGVGPGNYLTFMPRYVIPGEHADPVTPHNSLLYVASESGVFAALALAVAIGFALRFFASRHALILASTLGFIAFAANAMTTNLFSIASMAIAAWMLAPAVAAIRRGKKDRGDATSPPGAAPPHSTPLASDTAPSGAEEGLS
ncbi:MAG: O-antigen ligase family protein [Nakamurella sp.]